jgi:hypothetical protein
MTQAVSVTGEKETEAVEAETYANLMNEREPLVDELTDLRLQISQEEAATPEFEEITQAIKKITALDKAHLAVMEKLHAKTQKSYKGVKQGQRMFSGYNPLPGTEVPSTVDIKQ